MQAAEFASLLSHLSVLSVPRPNGSRALERTVRKVRAWLEKEGVPVQLHRFTLHPYFMELLGLWLALTSLLLPAAALGRWGWGGLILALVTLAVPLLEVRFLRPTVTALVRQPAHNLVVFFPAPDAAQEVILCAHLDSKTELLDHYQRAALLRLSFPAMGLALACGILTAVEGLLPDGTAASSSTGSLSWQACRRPSTGWRWEPTWSAGVSAAIPAPAQWTTGRPWRSCWRWPFDGVYRERSRGAQDMAQDKPGGWRRGSCALTVPRSRCCSPSGRRPRCRGRWPTCGIEKTGPCPRAPSTWRWWGRTGATCSSSRTGRRCSGCRSTSLSTAPSSGRSRRWRGRPALMAQVTSGTGDRMAVVADVHTHLEGGVVLEEAVGDPFLICVGLEGEGGRTRYWGAVFSYYEFKHPMGDRLTDEAWQATSPKPSLPPWTSAFLSVE